MQRHLRTCINTGRKLKVMMKRLSEEQILALSKPHSDVRDRKHLESAESLQHYVELDSNPMPCNFEQCNLFFSSSADLEKHRKVHLPPLSCNECGRLFRVKRALLLHIQRHFPSRPYVCDVPGCTYLAKVYDDLKIHKRKVHPSILYKCRKCGKSIKSQLSYMQHMAKHDADTPPGVIKCIYEGCQLMFKYVEIMRKHFIKAHTSVKKLTKCSNGTSKKQSHSGDHLRKFAKDAHKNVKQFQCNECGNFLASKQTLASHIVTHWDWRPYKCDYPDCSYSAKRSQGLWQHKNRVHTLKRRFTCSHCGKMFERDWLKLHEENHKTSTPGVLKCLHVGCQEIFSTSSDLLAHMKRHMINECDVPAHVDLHKNAIFVPSFQLCGEGYHSISNLKQHNMQIHETGEPGVIKCAKKHCKQTFTSIADFKKHLNNHNELTCQLCGKILKSGARHYLKKHLENHNTDTPGIMKCIFWGCKLTFISATDLKQHAFKHWDVSLRPFACDFPQCNYTCRENNRLLQHKRHVHSSNLYTCDMCGKQFKHLLNVAQHFRKFHKIQQSEENPSLNVERPNNSEEKQELIFKCEIEEVVFD
jgi:DNA-directed RNA polymerase subunit RPC12/RpoP